MIKDQNGNHVIQKVIEVVPREHLDFIMEAMRGQVSPLAQHTYGCRVIQRILERGTSADSEEILRELFAVANMLIMDQYGNYVAQHIIIKGKHDESMRMIQLVMNQLVSFSRHKFASNVVETCIQHATPEQRTSILQQFTDVGSDGTSVLSQMMRDQYGNYVIRKSWGLAKGGAHELTAVAEKLLLFLEGEEKRSLAEQIKPHFWALKKHGTNKQLQAMEKALAGAGASGSVQTDSNSSAPTPVLTNETNSPQSSSPSSTHASAVEVAAKEKCGATSASSVEVSGVAPQDPESRA